MNKVSLSKRWTVELIAIIFTLLLTVFVLMPILRNVPDYLFLVYNVVAILVFFTMTRHIFLLRFTPYAWFLPLKVVLIFAMIPLIVYLIDGLAEFQFYLDEEGTYSLVSHLPLDKQIPISNYIRSEMVFFSVGAIITTFIFPVRMIISIWREINRNTV